MGQHGNQIELGWLGLAPLIQFGEVGQALEQLLKGLLRIIKVFRVTNIGHHIRPVDQLHTVFLGNIKQGGEHLPRQLHRHLAHQVEFLITGQAVKDMAGTLANQRLQFGEVARNKQRGHHTPLGIMAGGIIGNKHG